MLYMFLPLRSNFMVLQPVFNSAIECTKYNKKHCCENSTFASVLSKTSENAASEVLSENTRKQADNYMPSTCFLGITFNDTVFAEFITKFDGGPVSTENPINWRTTGEHSLTDDEIVCLKGKYDITNMSPQDYYDLMADLSQLNAITVDKVVERYCFKSDTPYFKNQGIKFNGDPEKDFVDEGLLLRGENFRHLPINNYLKYLQSASNYFETTLPYIESEDFYRDNPSILKNQPEIWRKFVDGFYEGHDLYTKLLSTIVQLERK